jgi:hypothetical protein
MDEDIIKEVKETGKDFERKDKWGKVGFIATYQNGKLVDYELINHETRKPKNGKETKQI